MDNWAFQVSWCPRNLEPHTTAYLDGTIGIHTLQSTNDSETLRTGPDLQVDGTDVLDFSKFSRTAQPTLSLKQPPKRPRRPVPSSLALIAD